jgi:two-component system CitB family sensor kinase
VIAGLIELGRTDEAVRLIGEVSGVHQRLSETLLERVGDPVLGALLLAKAAAAAERGIELHVAEGTMLVESPLDDNDLITLVGNLIDNALDAATGSPLARVDVSVTSDPRDIVVQVRDSGAGVPEDLVHRIFVEGFTTKRTKGGRRRGLGLALVREVAGRYGGEVSVQNDGGALFEARVPRRIRATA